MKKANRFLLISLSIVGVILGVAAFALSTFDVFGNSKTVKSYAESASYVMNFDNNDNNNIKYYYGTRNFTKLNYNNEEIQFNYKRCRSGEDTDFIIISGDGCLYNPTIVNNSNSNSLCGISSMVVDFSSVKGNLYLSYGLSDNYVDTDIKLTSGVSFDFSSFKPSHFKLSTDNEANADYDVRITSISITYSSNEYYGQSEYNYTEILGNQGQKTLSPGASEVFSLNNTDIGTNNYISIQYKSSEKMTGVLTYIDQSNQVNKEEYFFLEESNITTDFNTFLDAFRKGCAGSEKKTLVSFKLTNVGNSSCSYTIGKFSYTNRTYSRSDVYYISDNSVEAGISLQFAGSLCSFKNLNLGIQEYVDSNKVVKIRASDKHSNDVTNVIANNPNLINIYDVGREVQQSWYMNVDEGQGYTRGTFNGNKVQYNPVQAGDMNNNESKIVDYSITYDKNTPGKITKIWIKTMALDWAQTNVLSKSYLENTYLVENGLLTVKNRFIDFSGWSNYENNDGFPTGTDNRNGGTFYNTSVKNLFSIQELPAIYTAHPLSYFSTNFTNSSNTSEGKLIFDDGLGWNISTTAIEHNSKLVANGEYNNVPTYVVDTNEAGTSLGNYHYEVRKHADNWMGFFNEDKFGLACFMPVDNYNHDNYDCHVYISGMLYRDHSASNKNNRYYLDSDYNRQLASYSEGFIGIGKKNLTKESCYVDNCGYMTSSLGFYVPNYSPMEYTYVIGADYLNTLQTKFSSFDQNRTFINDFTSWAGANI